MLLHARNLDLLPKTQSPPSPSQIVSSLLFEPSSRTLALMLSDTSFLLYPSLSPFSPTPAIPAPTPIPPLSTAACFVRLNPNRVVFFTASPTPSTILLRAWLLNNDLFVPARLSFKQDLRSALAIDLLHGLSVGLAGTVNILVVHSVTASKIWVMSVRLVEEDPGSVRLSRCAVIDCTLPIYSIGLSMGVLVLGEVGGVRVFPLRPLIKGRSVKQSSSMQKGLLAAQLVGSIDDSGKKRIPNGTRGLTFVASGRVNADYGPCRLRTAKLRQNSGDHCSFFVELRCTEVQNFESTMGALASVKAVAIHELSRKAFLIVDSTGDAYLLNLQNTTVKASEVHCHSLIASKDAHINRLSCTLKVQILAVLPDISTRTQAIWISDGGYSVHMVSVAEMGSPVIESEKDGREEKPMQMPAIQAIFTRDKVQDVVPFSANAVLVLGKGNIFAYAIA